MNSITKLHVLFFFVFIFYTVSCTAKLEKQTYTNVYDLHFAMRSDSAVVYPWRENGAYSNYTIPAYIQDCAKKRTDANNIKYFITGVFINFLSASVSPLFFPVFVLFSL
jgi:hypothetical protein